jgi:methylaspartate mutase sigma subunit
MNSTVLLTTIPSDAHGWNLVFMQMFLEERGCSVVNLGTCVPFDLLVQSCSQHPVDLIVVSTVNGHGYLEGLELAKRLEGVEGRENMSLVIGGKLGVDEGKSQEHARALRQAGFDAVFSGPSALDEFIEFLEREIGAVGAIRSSSGTGA